jgi:hypothetical protein
MKLFLITRENEMRTKTIYYVTFLLFLVSTFSLSGCSKLSGPSDADAIKAINESGAFKDLVMQSPIVVLQKDGPNKDGSWNVKVKINFSYEIKDKQMSPPVEKTPVYNLIKLKDNTGHTVWKVKYGP